MDDTIANSIGDVVSDAVALHEDTEKIWEGGQTAAAIAATAAQVALGAAESAYTGAEMSAKLDILIEHVARVESAVTMLPGLINTPAPAPIVVIDDPAPDEMEFDDDSGESDDDPVPDESEPDTEV